MSSSYSPNTVTVTQNDNDTFFSNEKKVIRNNIPLVISTSLVTAIYSYSMIDGNTNNAINRALLMALSTFISASAVNMLENQGYITRYSANIQYVEGAMIPLFYYFLTKKQFKIPDMQSQALKTGVISAVLGELAQPTISNYYNEYDQSTMTLQSIPVSQPSK